MTKAKKKPQAKLKRKKPTKKLASAKKRKPKTPSAPLLKPLKQPQFRLKNIQAESETDAKLKQFLQLYNSCATAKDKAAVKKAIQAHRLRALREQACVQPPASALPAAKPTKSITEQLQAINDQHDILKSKTPGPALFPSTTSPAPVPAPTIPALPAAPKSAPHPAQPLAPPTFANEAARRAVETAATEAPTPEADDTPHYWGPLTRSTDLEDANYADHRRCFGLTLRGRNAGSRCGHRASSGALWNGVALSLCCGLPYCEAHLAKHGGASMVQMYRSLITPAQRASFDKRGASTRF